MSHLDDLYKEAGIDDSPNKPRSKGPILSIAFYLAIYGAIIAFLYFNGSFGRNPNTLYYVLIGMSFLFTFTIRKIIKKNRNR